jgi:hypothetical protein
MRVRGSDKGINLVDGAASFNFQACAPVPCTVLANQYSAIT